MIIMTCVNAHMYLSNVIINGKQDNTCVREHPKTQYDYPLSDKNNARFETTTDMICGWSPAMTQLNRKCAIPAGSSISLQWWHANPGDDVVDSSHKGPCSVYLAKSDSGQGQVWFKIYEEGYNEVTKEWCTDRVRKDGANKGQLAVTIPSSLSAGNYLLRSEFWALHEGYAVNGAQPYVGCLELTISGSGTVTPNNLVNMVGLFKSNDPGLYFNIYNQDPKTYVVPGPRISITGGGGGTNPTTAPGTPTNAPTREPPQTICTTCVTGASGCPCDNKGYCDRGLSCHNATKLCLPLECNTGAEKCICTQGGSCDIGLSCYSNLCVRVPDRLQADDASSLSLSFSLTVAVILSVIVAFM